jgi:leucine dehydrogenase
MALKIAEIPTAGWERVVRAEDPDCGFRSIIAIHDTTLGPALGGLRMWPYRSEEEALFDVLRLSRGMTYKSAVARTGLGGGKSILIGDAATGKTPDLFRAMGAFVESLGGRYITAEDVGTSVEDMRWIRERTNWVTGRGREEGGSGDPSPFTAYGVFLGIKAYAEEVLGRSDLRGLRVALQGAGHVALCLARRLKEAGAEMIACDVVPSKVERIVNELGVAVCDPDAIYDQEVDVFSPNALGAVINDDTIPRLRCRVVAGGANNVLLEPRHAAALKARGIAYAPDYVINGGGVINVSFELVPGGYDEAASTRKVEGIYGTLKQILRIADEKGITTAEAADHLAEEILAEGRRRRGLEGAGEPASAGTAPAARPAKRTAKRPAKKAAKKAAKRPAGNRKAAPARKRVAKPRRRAAKSRKRTAKAGKKSAKARRKAEKARRKAEKKRRKAEKKARKRAAKARRKAEKARRKAKKGRK